MPTEAAKKEHGIESAEDQVRKLYGEEDNATAQVQAGGDDDELD